MTNAENQDKLVVKVNGLEKRFIKGHYDCSTPQLPSTTDFPQTGNVTRGQSTLVLHRTMSLYLLRDTGCLSDTDNLTKGYLTAQELECSGTVSGSEPPELQCQTTVKSSPDETNTHTLQRTVLVYILILLR